MYKNPHAKAAKKSKQKLQPKSSKYNEQTTVKETKPK